MAAGARRKRSPVVKPVWHKRVPASHRSATDGHVFKKSRAQLLLGANRLTRDDVAEALVLALQEGLEIALA